MKENYLISIRGRQQYDGESGKIDIDTLGSYVIRGGKKYISYREYDEDDPNRSHLTTLRVDDENHQENVTMIHSGGATRLFLQKGQRNICRYDTGMGTLMLGVFTNSLHSTLGENGGELSLDYTLDINASVSSRNFVHVSVREAPGNPETE